MSEPFNAAQPSDGSVPKDVLMPRSSVSERVETIRSLMERGIVHLPTRYGYCSCACHSTPGMSHMAACCNPTDLGPSLFDDPITRGMINSSD